MAYTDDELPSGLDVAGTLAAADLIVVQQSGDVVVKGAALSALMTAILSMLGDTDTTLAANSDLKLATQKATKAYADAIASGVQTKDPVVAATTANGTLATAFENGDTIDGVVLATGNRILLKNQTAPEENGIRVVQASGAPTRATDADSSGELVNATVLVTGGTVNAHRTYRQTTPGPITVDTTGLSWSMVSDGTADVRSNTGSSVVNEIALFADTAGKLIKRSSGSGYPLLASGVLSVLTLAQLLTNLQGDGLTGAYAGFRNLPINSQSGDYTCLAADSGKCLLHPSADTTPRTFTIPSNASVAYPTGTCLTFVCQNGAGALTIAINADTMRLGGDGTAGSRTLAANGICTAVKLTATEWLISGTNLT